MAKQDKSAILNGRLFFLVGVIWVIAGLLRGKGFLMALGLASIVVGYLILYNAHD